MRVAVCISGACKTKSPLGDLVENNEIIKSNFPGADFYYATWEQFAPEFKNAFPKEKCKYFPEPDMHYHPYTDIKKEDHISPYYQQTVEWVVKNNKKEWTSHHTKQILIHSWLINEFKNNYDIIVRARYDDIISEHANFLPYVDDTFQNHRANCFGAAMPNTFDNITTFDAPVNIAKGWDNRLLDVFIIHNADAIDNDNVNLLHKEQKLHAAEFGWYQVINTQHKNHSGWVNIN